MSEFKGINYGKPVLSCFPFVSHSNFGEWLHKQGKAESKSDIKKSRGNKMLILKHVEYEVKDNAHLENLLGHIRKTTSQVEGIIFIDIYFIKGKKRVCSFFWSVKVKRNILNGEKSVLHPRVQKTGMRFF